MAKAKTTRRLLGLTAVTLLSAAAAPCAAFAPVPSATRAPPPPPRSSRPRPVGERRVPPPLRAADDDDSDDESKKKEVSSQNPLELASWYAVEAFGKAFGSRTSPAASGAGDDDPAAVDLARPPSSLAETLTRIQRDNDRSYFLSGEVDALVYDEECTFADPFVAFDGRDRFVDNLANLGSFITNYDARVMKYEVEEGGRRVETKVMVKLELNLPWKPVLAWPWGVTYEIDEETFLVTTHRESWDVAPLEGVKQIFRKPTVKIGNK